MFEHFLVVFEQLHIIYPIKAGFKCILPFLTFFEHENPP